MALAAPGVYRLASSSSGNAMITAAAMVSPTSMTPNWHAMSATDPRVSQPPLPSFDDALQAESMSAMNRWSRRYG